MISNTDLSLNDNAECANKSERVGAFKTWVYASVFVNTSRSICPIAGLSSCLYVSPCN